MLRVLPWIDGVNSVKQIALLADADFKLVKKAIRHLLYYGCVLLLDIFSFSAIYAPTAEISEFVENKKTQEECARYVALPESHNGMNESSSFPHSNLRGKEEDEQTMTPISGTHLAELYLSIKHGQSVKSWCIDHTDIVPKMDIRRFITFGIIKGFLYRVHRYPFATSASAKLKRLTKANLERTGMVGKGLGHGHAPIGDKGKVAGGAEAEDAELMGYLDGTRCFDEICTDLMISERELVARLKAMGDLQIICR